MKRTAVVAGAIGATLAVAALGAATVALRPAPDAPGSVPRAGAAAGRDGALAGDARRGEVVFRACAACHSVGRAGPDVDGPNLYGVVGARIAGRRPRYGYTQALRDLGGTWTAVRLDAWLADPAAVAPGTAMGFPGLPSAQDRADVIAYLAAQGPAR